MDFRHLRYFVAVAEEGTFTRAARRLFIAQPALSKQIQDLEDEIGTRLLVRNARGATLTPPGAELLERARTILARETATRERMRALAAAPLVPRAAPARVRPIREAPYERARAVA